LSERDAFLFDHGDVQARPVKSAATAERLNGAALPAAPADAVQSAKVAGLRYVTDDMPGYRRRRNGKGFVCTRPSGEPIRDPQELRRIRALAIPPAWRDVWICPSPDGHLQATGRDIKGRKQHRYHQRWREVRDATKYDRMLAFGKKLPEIRRQVDRDLALTGLPREKILATVVRLLEVSRIRVGNEEYARQNNSFGLATLRNRHVSVSGSNISFEFRGKSGVQHALSLNDRRLARIIKRCQELPGHELFQYIDETGARCTIGSADVNEYLRSIAGEDFSSKDFRTWAGTVLAARALVVLERPHGKTQLKRNVAQVVESVAKKLGNTKAVCRKCYIHPAVFDSYGDGSLLRLAQKRTRKVPPAGVTELSSEEAAVLALLERAAKNKKTPSLRRQLRRSLQHALGAG
jgi:DNA topoisomerase-1